MLCREGLVDIDACRFIISLDNMYGVVPTAV